MSVLILSILVQVALIIHVVKTGRNQIWIWVLALLSLPGALAYIAVEILPELLRSRAAQRTARGLRQAVDPGRELRRYENEARVAGNVASRQRYAEELVRHERYEEAIGQYRGHSPDCMSTTPISCSDSRRLSSARATHPRRAPRSMSSSGTTRIFAHRQGISCTPGRSRRKATYRRRSRSTRCWRPPTPAPKPRCVTRSCCRPRVVVPRRRRWRASCSS